jgi:MFS family permease
MGISEESPQVGIIVAVYYLGCSVGAVFFSWFADKYGRKPARKLGSLRWKREVLC